MMQQHIHNPTLSLMDLTHVSTCLSLFVLDVVKGPGTEDDCFLFFSSLSYYSCNGSSQNQSHLFINFFKSTIQIRHGPKGLLANRSTVQDTATRQRITIPHSFSLQFWVELVQRQPS